MAKKKLPFIKLSIAFFIIILLAIFISWGNYKENNSGSGMDQSMGNMMGENHLKDITISDLIKQQEVNETMKQGTNDTSSHHSSTGFLKILHKMTTITIVLFLPLIIAGSVFLMIIWFDRA